MLITNQTILNSNGDMGNCFTACIASLLEESIEDVPHFVLEENWREAINKWLAKKNLFYIDILLSGDMRDELVKYWGYHVISGPSPRGHCHHSIIGYKGEPYFDPHPSRLMLGTGHCKDRDEWQYGFIIPRELIHGESGKLVVLS